MSVRIAVVQFQISHLKPEENIKRIEDFIRQASEGHANVVIFPEDCITGSIFGDVSKLDSLGNTRKTFQEQAKKYAIDIVTGSVMEGTPEGNFNTSYYIDSTGNVLGTYRKNHLHPSEFSFLQAGVEAPVFQTAYGKAGIVICWDMLFPEIFQRLKARGVQLIYCPSYWYKEVAGSLTAYNKNSEENQLDALCIVRVLETNSALIYANAAGTQIYTNGDTDTLIGHSQITMPALGALKRLQDNAEQMFFQDVDLSLLKKTVEIYQQ